LTVALCSHAALLPDTLGPMLLALAIIAFLLLAMLVARIRVYGRLLSDAHFLNIGQGMPALRAGAFTESIRADQDAIRSSDDARVLKTDAGMAIVYTIVQQGSDFVHHCSVGLPGDHVAHGTLDFLLSFVLLLLKLPLDQMRFEIGAGSVHHAQINLSEAEHAALAALPSSDTSPTHLFALRAAAVEARKRR
jgi:hypothetical protein